MTENDKKVDRRKLPNKKRDRNLKQYSDLSDDEFNDIWERNLSANDTLEDLERRREEKFEEFSRDYDIDDLKINDRETLKALIDAIIALEDYEIIMHELRSSSSVSASNITLVDRLSRVMSDLRGDISKLQDTLSITRKTRKSDKEASVISYIEKLKKQAKTFYENRLTYIYCPKCHMLLGNIWMLYPENDNKFSFVCGRETDGEVCGTKVVVSSKELMEKRGTNVPEIMPESML